MPGSKYTDQESKEAMAIWAISSGKRPKVEELLKEHGSPVPYNTLLNWVYRQPRRREEYQQIQSEVQSLVHARLEDGFSAIASDAVEIVGRVLGELQIRTDPLLIHELKTPELLKIMHEAAVTADISMDQALKLGGKPTQISEYRFPDIAKALKERHGITLSFVEGDAVEEPIGELEEQNAG